MQKPGVTRVFSPEELFLLIYPFGGTSSGPLISKTVRLITSNTGTTTSNNSFRSMSWNLSSLLLLMWLHATIGLYPHRPIYPIRCFLIGVTIRPPTVGSRVRLVPLRRARLLVYCCVLISLIAPWAFVRPTLPATLTLWLIAFLVPIPPDMLRIFPAFYRIFLSCAPVGAITRIPN